METFQINSSEDFMIMPNHHLKNKELSLNAKGLLSLLINFKDVQDYSLNSHHLTGIFNDEINLEPIIQELESEGYLTHCEVRDEKGVLLTTQYVVLEFPKEKMNRKVVASTELSNSIR